MIVELSENEVKIILNCLGEIHENYNEDGVISLFEEKFKEQDFQTLGVKLEKL